LSKISRLYIPLLEEFKITTLDEFVERFYQRVSKERFERILRTYRIAPSQHKEKFILEALHTIVTARDETHTRQPSETLSSSVSSYRAVKRQEPTTTDLSASQVQSTRETISSIDEMLKTDIKNDKRERLLSRKEYLESTISIPESSEKATISDNEALNYLPLL